MRATAAIQTPNTRETSRRVIEPRRATRINVLLVVIVVLAAADLALTLLHLFTVGIYESNPLARVVLRTHDVTLITLYKASLIAFASWILYRLRWSPLSEAAAWTAALIHVALMFQWNLYAHEVSKLEPTETHYITTDAFIAPPLASNSSR